ncbi:MAG: hypothetical protein ACLP8S_00810 [Solirubrobacteraceae bacterium]
MRLRSGARCAVVLALTVVGALGLFASGGSSAAPPESLTVVFTGSGTYTVAQLIDATAEGGCTLNTSDTFNLSWQTKFTIPLTTQAGVRVAGTATGSLAAGPGSFALTGSATSGNNCSQVVPETCPGLLPAIGSPTMKYGVGFGQDSFAPQAFSLDGSSPPVCAGGEGPLVTDDMAVFVNFVPANLLGSPVSISDAALRAGPQTVNVSQASSPPSDCSSLLKIRYPVVNYTCTESLQWSGTVTASVSNPCTNSPKVCVDPAQKQQAQSDAAGYNSAQRTAKQAYQGLGCGPGPTSNFDGNDVAYACAAAGVAINYDAQMANQAQAIADDPPDSNYNSIASTHPPKITLLHGRDTQKVDKLLEDLTLARVLAAAVVTSLDRASGAFDANDSSAVTAQNAAALADATRAASTLGAAVALLPNAISQIGKVHERGYEAVRKLLVTIKPKLISDAASAQSLFASFAAQHPS